MKDLPFGIRLSIYIFVIFIIIIIYRFAIFSSKEKDIIKKQGQYNQIYTELINLIPQVTEDKFKAVLQELDLAKESYRKLADYLPAGMGDYTTLYDELTNLARDNNIKLDIFQAQRGSSRREQSAFAEKIFFDMTMNGDFASLVHFFYSFSSLQNILNVEKFDINSSSSEGGKSLILVKGTFSSYKFKIED